VKRRAARALAAAGWAAGVAIGLGGLVAAVVYILSERALERRHAVPAAIAPASTPERGVGSLVDAALLERGQHLVTVVAQCTYCHGPDLAGRAMADDPWIGRLHASNLTRGAGGVGAALTDEDWRRALRHGVDRAGRSLLLMPSAQLARLSDRDLAAIVAYVRQVPAVDRVWPERRAGWLTRMVVAAGLAPDLLAAEQAAAIGRDASPVHSASGVELASTAGHAREIAAEPTASYGEYLVSIGSCRVCHRADLAGGLHPLSLPGEPVPPDLTPGGPLAGWSRDDFARAMREGRTPDGRALDREFMPWPAFAALSDTELDALWRYLRALDAVVPDVEPAPGGDVADDTQIARGTSGPVKG